MPADDRISARRQDLGHGNRLGQIRQQAVDHHVANELNPLRPNPFPFQIRKCAALRRIQDIRNLVGENAIDLFGHPAIIAAQAGLYVYDRNMSLHRNQRAGNGRIDIADHELTSPTTTTARAPCASITGSKRFMTSAV